MWYVITPGRDGVVGDGAFDDTPALERIFEQEPWVAFEPNELGYAVSRLHPAPWSRVRCPPGLLFSSAGGSNDPILDLVGANGTVWAGGSFDGGSQPDGSETVVRAAGVVDAVLRGATIIDGYRNGVLVNGDADTFELDRCAIDGCGQRSGVKGSDLHGVKWMGPGGLIRRCTLRHNGYSREYGDAQVSNSSAIKVLGNGSRTVVVDNVLEWNGGKAIEVGADRCGVKRNVIRFNEELGVFGRECSRLWIAENVIVGNLNNGIDVNTVEDCRVDDNECLYNGSSRNSEGQNQEGSGIFVNSCVRGRIRGNDCFGNSQGQLDLLPAYGGDGRSGIRFSDKGDPTYGYKVYDNVCTDPREDDGFTAALAGTLTEDDQELELADIVGTIPDDGPFTVLIGAGDTLEGVICRVQIEPGHYQIWRAENNCNGLTHQAGEPVRLVKTQKYGIHQKKTDGSDDYQIAGNDVRGNREAGIKDASGLEDDAPVVSPVRLIRGNLTDA